MKLLGLTTVLFASTTLSAVIKREAQFQNGQPIDGKGKGGPILGKLPLSLRVPADLRDASDIALP
jgi:hypothetical protein